MKEPEKKSQQRQPTKNSMQYTGMAVQMLVPIVIGFFGGVKLDEYLQNKIPICTLLLGLTGIAVGIYLSIKDFIKK